MGKRIFVAVLITLAVLTLTRRMSMNRPRDIRYESGGVEVFHRTVTSQFGKGRPVLRIKVAGKSGLSCSVLVRMPDGQVERKPLQPDSSGTCEAVLPSMKKGTRLGYAFLVSEGGRRILRLPPREGRYFILKYKGHVSKTVLAFHIAFMFASFFFMVLAFLGSLRMLKGIEGKQITVNNIRWALALTFIGGWPLGFVLNYQAFGPVWEGFPFGYDITDNKTQFMFIFWIILSLLARGSIYKGDESKDLLDDRGFAIAVLVCFIVSVIVFLIPHSLSF
ncbi:hypothetical protein DRQ05_03940 [bacterium]|nr:MAG: hypothetical protein DRQ05_03940 [bacterium]